jgi:hypothetical protein
MVTNDHVSTGMQPFLFPEEAIEGALSAKALYEGSSAPPLSDFSVVMQAKPGAPPAIYQARNQVRRVHVLLIVLFGEDHRLTKAYERFYYLRFTSAEAKLHRYQQGLPVAREQLLFSTKILSIMPSISVTGLRCKAIHQQHVHRPVSSKCLMISSKSLPSGSKKMSFGFLKELKLESLGVVQPTNQSGTPGATPRGNPTKTPKDTQAEDAAASKNPHFLEAVFGEYRKLNKVRTRQIRRKIAEKELPALPLSKVDSQPVCLAWHTKGQCNMRCHGPVTRRT